MTPSSNSPTTTTTIGMTRDKAFCSQVLQCRFQHGPDYWSEENLQRVLDLWQLSPEMEQRLRALKDRVADVQHFKNDPHILVRFLHGPWGHHQAETMFRRMIDWRRQNRVDTILDDYVPPQLLLDAIPSAVLKDYDREGDPIYVERGGAVDTAGLLRVFTREELMRYCIWTRERNTNGVWINDYERRQGRLCKAITIIYDLKGLSSRQLHTGGIDFFKETMRITQEYFPGPIKRMIIIRAPRIFQIAWSIVRHFFPISAQKKMIFLGNHGYLDVLDKYVDINALPRSIYDGGSGDVAVGMMQHLDGIDKVPDDYCRYHMPGASSSSSYYPSKDSTAETDEESLFDLSSDESTPPSPAGGAEVVIGKVILRGSWKKGKDGRIVEIAL